MPVLTTGWTGTQNYEWRRVEADSYDNLLATINRLASAGPTIHSLTPEQELELARCCMPATKENLAYVMEQYLKLRLGLGVDDSTLCDPRYTHVVDEMVLFLLRHSVPDFPNTPDVIAYIRKFAAGRPLNLPMAKAAFEKFKKEQRAAEQKPAPPQVGEAELQSASDEDIQQALTGVRREHAQAEQRRRQMLRYDSRQYQTADQAIQAVRAALDPEE